MNCRDVEKMLSAFMDGELKPDVRSAVASHLGECGTCPKRLAESGAVWDALGRLPGARPAPYLYTRLSARIRETRRRAPWPERFLIPATAAAAAVLGFWLGYLAGANGDSANALSAQASTAVPSTAYIDALDPVPASSFGDAYFAMAVSK